MENVNLYACTLTAITDRESQNEFSELQRFFIGSYWTASFVHLVFVKDSKGYGERDYNADFAAVVIFSSIMLGLC